jgi:hypothetical protein
VLLRGFDYLAPVANESKLRTNTLFLDAHQNKKAACSSRVNKQNRATRACWPISSNCRALGFLFSKTLVKHLTPLRHDQKVLARPTNVRALSFLKNFH